jgi:hypothetical protein
MPSGARLTRTGLIWYRASLAASRRPGLNLSSSCPMKYRSHFRQPQPQPQPRLSYLRSGLACYRGARGARCRKPARHTLQHQQSFVQRGSFPCQSPVSRELAPPPAASSRVHTHWREYKGCRLCHRRRGFPGARARRPCPRGETVASTPAVLSAASVALRSDGLRR